MLIKLNRGADVKNAAVIMSTKDLLPNLFVQRAVNISRLSGRPQALHSIGQIQRAIDTTSYPALLKSLYRLFNIAFVTAQVIETLDGVKMERHQVSKDQIISYVEQTTRSMDVYKPDQEDTEIIAALIVSFNANEDAWALVGTSNADRDLHAGMFNMYKSVLKDTPTAELAMYLPASDSIGLFGAAPHITQAKKSAGSQGAEAVKQLSHALEAAGTVHRLACCRVIDHVYSMLLDTDLWYEFVRPRTRGDVATNLDRARGLRLFAGYLKSLLMYNYFFSIGAYLKSYDLVQDWLMHFPPLSDTTKRLIEGTIKGNDVFDAVGEAAAIFDSMSKSGQADGNTLVFPEEFLSSFELKNTIEEVRRSAIKDLSSRTISNFKELGQPLLMPILSGIAISKFDVGHDVAKVVIVQDKVTEQIRLSVTSLLPALTRGLSGAVVEQIKALNCKPQLPFTLPAATTYAIDGGVDKRAAETIVLDSGAPQFSDAYHTHVREKAALVAIEDVKLLSDYAFKDLTNAIDYERAKYLRTITSLEWKTLIPWCYTTGMRRFSKNDFVNNPQSTIHLIETLIGRDYETIVRQLSLPHFREMVATYFSSFALLYFSAANSNSKLRVYAAVDDKTPTNAPGNKSGKKTDIADASTNYPQDVVLQKGIGSPYGMSYEGLQELQESLTPDSQVIPIGAGCYLRFLDKVPQVAEQLETRPPLFFNQHPFMYFAANGTTIGVDYFVISDGLTNFSLFPVPSLRSLPQVKMTPHYVYATNQLVLNLDIHYAPSVPQSARESYPCPLSVHDWKGELTQYHLRWINFGKYGDAGRPAILDELPADVITVSKVIAQTEKVLDNSQKEQAAITDKVEEHVEDVKRKVDEGLKKNKVGEDKTNAPNIEKDEIKL